MSTHFVKHESCDECGSTDAKAIYSDNSSHCFSCEHTVPSKEYLEENQRKPAMKVRASAVSPVEEKPVKEKSLSNKMITEEQKEDVKRKTCTYGNDYRDISDEVLKFYGCRTEFDDEGEVSKRYYPYTLNGQLSGFKVRTHPKTFGGNVGETGNTCELYGQFRFPNGGKYLLVVEGEEDAMAAYQMFLEYSRNKSSDFVTAAVSLGQGVKSKKQLSNNYEFLNKFDNIILGLDSDEAGQGSIDELIAVMPKGKVKICHWSKAKDPNQYLENDNARQFLADFYNAEPYVPVGVIGSGQLYERMLQKSGQPKVPFPPLFKELNEMFVGGLSLGYIVNIASDTGIGKTTIVNEMCYHWIFHSPHKVGILSMELDDAQYAEVMVSRHLEKKLALMDDADKMKFIRTKEFQDIANNLFKNDDGSDRFYLVDDRDGSVEDLQDAIEKLIIAAGCKVIVIDVLQDVLDGLSNEEQSVFMKWAKSMIKSHGVLFIFINHKRKTQGEKVQGKVNMDESDIHGSSTIIKSAGVNILIGRDKMSEDPIIRNTTMVAVSKNRVCGLTGPAGALYYENEKHKLTNFEEYFGMTFQEWLEKRKNENN